MSVIIYAEHLDTWAGHARRDLSRQPGGHGCRCHDPALYQGTQPGGQAARRGEQLQSGLEDIAGTSRLSVTCVAAD
ncbi:hypothetical protein QNM99_27215 [Pseudomonas sp. PCH446]